MTPRPWSTQPVTGAQHRQWMAEERENRAIIDEAVQACHPLERSYFRMILERAMREST